MAYVGMAELRDHLTRYVQLVRSEPIYVAHYKRLVGVLIAPAQYRYLLTLVEELNASELDMQELTARIVEQQITINELRREPQERTCDMHTPETHTAQDETEIIIENGPDEPTAHAMAGAHRRLDDPTADPFADLMEPGDLPPAFHDDGGSETLTQDQITGARFNTAQRQEDLKQMEAPPGDYVKTARWTGTFQRSHYADDARPGDVYPKDGRVIYSISGKPDAKTVGGIEYQPVLFLRISPDRRMDRREDKKGEFDFLYRMYQRVCETFLATHGRQLEGEADLLEFLEEGEYTITTGKQDDGRLMTLGVKRTLKPGERRYQRR